MAMQTIGSSSTTRTRGILAPRGRTFAFASPAIPESQRKRVLPIPETETHTLSYRKIRTMEGSFELRSSGGYHQGDTRITAQCDGTCSAEWLDALAPPPGS